MPVTFGLTITQVEKGHPFLVKLGELLDGAKQDAAAQISKLVLPEERAKAAAERSAAAETLYTNELEAELKVREVQKDYDAVTDDAGKAVLRVKLEIEKRKRDRAGAAAKSGRTSGLTACSAQMDSGRGIQAWTHAAALRDQVRERSGC